MAPGVEESKSAFDPKPEEETTETKDTDKWGNKEVNPKYTPGAGDDGQSGSGHGPKSGHQNIMNHLGKPSMQWSEDEDGERVKRHVTKDDNPYAGPLRNFDTTATGAGAKRGTERTSAYDIRMLMKQGHSAKRYSESTWRQYYW